MPLDLHGYLLEPPRIGSSNSPYTASPNNLVSNQSNWDAAYPNDESVPNDHYMALALAEGKLPQATFGWAKNETLSRFGYNGRGQRFQTLPGGTPDILGVIDSNSDTKRLKAPLLISTNTVLFPIRLSASGTGSGFTFHVFVVPDEAHFIPNPSPGTVEVAKDTGALNWCPDDLVTYAGCNAVWQRQTFREIAQGAGNIGTTLSMLLLAPLPVSGQCPLLRLGYGPWLIAVERAHESAFAADPAPGTVEWAADTGRLKFNLEEGLSGKTVYYDGVLMQAGISLPSVNLGLVSSPLPLSPLPVEGGDIIFQAVLPGAPTYQFRTTTFVDAPLDPAGIPPGAIQIERVTGNIGLNPQDALDYTLYTLTACICDLPLEHGVALRLYRALADPGGTDPTINDVTVFYHTTEAILAEPITGNPMVYLPALPFESADPNYGLRVMIEQGTGSFISDNFPNLLTTATPDALTYGYTLDYDAGQIKYALRRIDCIIDRPLVGASTPLLDGMVSATNLTVALQQSGGWRTLDLTKDAFLEPMSGVVYFTKTAGSLVAQGTRGEVIHNFLTNFPEFVDANAGLGPVLAGDLLYVSSETTPNTVKGIYQVVRVLSPSSMVIDVTDFPNDHGPLTFEVRRGSETLADRYFVPVVLADPFTKVERFPLLGTITNDDPRLAIPTKWVSSTVRFRYGATRYSTTVSIVDAFTNPTAWTAGTVEILKSTGELNFAQVDVIAGGTVYCGHTLVMGTDYQVTAELGLIAFTDRLFAHEEGLITYVPSATETLTTEKMCFLVRKELAQPHPANTSTVYFNPNKHLVANNPAPAVYRSGRPQDTTQVSVSTQNSTITFLADNHLDGLLPHGAIVGPTENIYIDYYIYDAVGGEQTTYVLSPPITLAQVNINEGDIDFGIQGDWTGTFQAGYALRLGTTEVHVIGNVTLAQAYKGVAYPSGITVVALEPHDYFRDDWQKPQLFVSSGLVRGNFFWSYFVPDLSAYNMVPRGAQSITFEGDCTATIKPGIVLKWAYGTTLDYNLVTGAGYDADTGTTVATLASPAARQYYGVLLHRSIRPIFEASVKDVQTLLPPVQTNMPALPNTMRNVLVYSRKDGARGLVLRSPQDYTMDDAGHVTFQQALETKQEWVILYTGHQNIAANLQLKASYTAGMVPTEDNGLLGQSLRANYATFSPDSFYYRVVKMQDFRNEYADELRQATTSTGTSGPMLSNTGGAQLYAQGQPSDYFMAGHLANDDIVARSTLKFYNDSINLLEDILEDLDGRIVGGEDGRFKFDGSITNPRDPLDPTQPFVWSTVTNQIDDLIKVLDAPFGLTWDSSTGWVTTALGTYIQAYQASQWSRFYPTWQRRFGVTTIGYNTGDPVMDTGSKNLTSVTNLRTRLAWAVTTQFASATQSTLTVDNATGSKVNIRPTFKASMLVLVQLRDGTILTTPTPLVLASVTATLLTFTTPIGVVIPMGSTVYRSPDDTFGAGPPITDDAVFTYTGGRDYTYDPSSGQITYIKPFPPLDGTVPLIPPELQCHPLPAKTALSCEVTLNNADTAPAQIPALYGGATDDDGEVLFPIQSPTFDCESTLNNTAGYLANEHLLITPTTGFIRHVTVDPFISQGDLDATRTVITVTGPGIAVLPQRFDLVRIVPDAPGVPTAFHQVLSSTSTTITVDYPFDTQYLGFTFVLANAPNVCAGAFATVHDRTLTDVAAHFLTSGVVPGQTIVITGGVYTGNRHQISKVVSDTELEFEYPEAATVETCNYRVSNSLSTFGSLAGTGTLLDQWQADLTGELGVTFYNVSPPFVVNSEVQALYQFFDLVFTYIATSTGAVDNLTLTDPTAHFVTAGVKVNDLVYLNSGLNLGFYPVATVADETHLTVSSAFPFTSNTAYRVGRSFGVANDTLTKLMAELKLIYPFVHDTGVAQALVQTAVPIVVPAFGVVLPGGFARGCTGADLDMRDTGVQARTLYTLPTFKSTVENSLTGGDALYDRRYTWIDARINLETGLVAQILRARLSRMKKQLTVKSSLMMLKAVSPA